MAIDHKVIFRAYYTIMQIVMLERRRNGIDHLCSPNFRRVFESYVVREGNDKRKPRLVLFDRAGDPFFDRKSLTVHVNRELWREAGWQEPLACFMLLHELAHILMHLHPVHSFSRAEHSGLASFSDEESAEWQANVFAALFMAPPYLAIGCVDRASFSGRFNNFPSEFIDFWFALQERRPLQSRLEFCSKCGCSPLIEVGSLLMCTNCGTVRMG
jgi:hypothetical protein